jgi:predicted exporter
MTLPSERLLPRLFLILLLAVLALAGWQWRHGAPLSANLMELVPGTTPDALELRAEQRMQEPLNREMLVLVGHADRQQAIAWRSKLGEQWQASGLFERSSGTCKPTCRPCARNCCKAAWRCCRQRTASN